MTDIPDIRSALIEGRYAYDFVSDICGDLENEEPQRRLREVENMLAEPEGSKALYVLIIAGTRKMLDAVTKPTPGERPAAAQTAGLAARLDNDSELDRLALYTTSSLGGDPGSDAR